MINYIVNLFNKRFQKKIEKQNEILEFERIQNSNQFISSGSTTLNHNNFEYFQQAFPSKYSINRNYSDEYIQYIADKLDGSIRYTDYGRYGSSGPSGIPGSTGLSGPSGILGSTGLSGPSGLSGISGPYQKKKEINRIYSDIDPYGEENWDEN